jgi:hypothetical protein
VAEDAARGLDEGLGEIRAAGWPWRRDLCHATDAGDPDIDDLDRARLEHMPVLGPVQTGKARENLRERNLVQFPFGKRRNS